MATASAQPWKHLPAPANQRDQVHVSAAWPTQRIVQRLPERRQQGWVNRDDWLARATDPADPRALRSARRAPAYSPTPAPEPKPPAASRRELEHDRLWRGAAPSLAPPPPPRT